MREIDEAVLVLDAPSSKKQGRTQDLTMLREVQQQIFAAALPANELQAAAESIWDSNGSQWGFVAACRRLFYEARTGNHGGLYNEAYLYGLKCVENVKKLKRTPEADLLAVIAEIFYDWQTSRSGRNAPANDFVRIDWDFLSSVCGTIIQDPTYRYSAFHRFMLGLSLAQSKEWTQSNAQFQHLRRQRMPFYLQKVPRAIYLNQDGLRQRFQGEKIKTDGGQYFRVDELSYTFGLSKEKGWPDLDKRMEAYIVFSYHGPYASMEDPLS